MGFGTVRRSFRYAYAEVVIVNLTNDGWEAIYQRAHGLLATKLAARWREDERGPFWVELLAAITQHDNNQKEFRGDNYLTLVGAPADFMIASGSPLEQAKRVVDDASYAGRYVALMTSMHTTNIYAARRDEGFAAFLDEQKGLQKKWRRALRLSKADAERGYAVMNWCDRLSLILCGRELPSDARRLEVAPLPGGETSFVWEREDKTVGLEPWPFRDDRFEVGVEVKMLSQLRFESDEALRAALNDAPTEVRRWAFLNSPLGKR